MQPRLVIFDCDGVLVDSEPLASKILWEELVKLGLTLSKEQTDLRFRGRSLTDCVKLIEAELQGALPANFIEKLDKRTFAVFETNLSAIPGVKAAIEALRARDLPICVASSGSHEKLRLTLGLTSLLPYFKGAIFSASDVENGKPAPDLFLWAAKKMEVSISNCVVVEDSLAGVEAGRRAGAKVLAYVPSMSVNDDAVLPFSQAGAEPFSNMNQLSALLLP